MSSEVSPTAKRLGFFTRLLDEASAGERYRLAMEQIAMAERCGYETAWVAQHHFVESEGGLPAPFVFLAHAASRTSRIRLGTGIVVLPLEQPLRVAEDAAVLDLLSGGRLELGLGAGGTPSAFVSFGLDVARRNETFGHNMQALRAALRGETLPGGRNHLYPAASDLPDRIWQASFSVSGATRAGQAGDGLMLSRTQPRPAGRPHATLADLQIPMIDAYLAALPPGRSPRIMGSRSVFVADDRTQALNFAQLGLRRYAERLHELGRDLRGDTVNEMIAAMDSHVGTPEDVTASLAADRVLDRVTDLVVQVHSIDPPHPYVLRSIELMAEKVAPSLGWRRPDATRPERQAAFS